MKSYFVFRLTVLGLATLLLVSSAYADQNDFRSIRSSSERQQWVQESRGRGQQRGEVVVTRQTSARERMSVEERRQLRSDIHDAGRDIYRREGHRHKRD